MLPGPGFNGFFINDQKKLISESKSPLRHHDGTVAAADRLFHCKTEK
jgi:hypothetical protein